ncbi:unnamed protein product [Discula destructiva]
MGASQDTTPQSSEKDRLRAHYAQQEKEQEQEQEQTEAHMKHHQQQQQQQQQQQSDQDRSPLPTPSSVSLGSPISPLPSSPLNVASAAGDSMPSSSANTKGDSNHVPSTPPPYSGPVSVVRAPTQQSTYFSASGPPPKYPGLPLLNYHLYSPPLFELSADCTTLKSTAPYLSSNASALIDLLRAQSTVPPKPQVHITGRRGGPHHRPDFALKLNLMPLLVPDDPVKRMDYIRCVGAGEPALRGGVKPSLEPELEGLEAWARRFVEDGAQVKAFELERVVANLDAAWLEGQIRSLVAAMGYRGAVSVAFPVTHARVVVQSPDRVNRFFTGLATLFAGRRTYEVVKAVWPFASCRREEGGGGGRVCVVQSEEQWWREWANPIRLAISGRRHGWVTVEDELEVIMEGKGKKGLEVVDWGKEA